MTGLFAFSILLRVIKSRRLLAKTTRVVQVAVQVEHTCAHLNTNMSYHTSNLLPSDFAEGLSFKPTTTTYNTLMKACGSDYYHAKALMDEMKTEGLFPNQISWSILADICGSSGNVEGALQVTHRLIWFRIIYLFLLPRFLAVIVIL